MSPLGSYLSHHERPTEKGIRQMSEWNKTTPERIVILVLIVVLLTAMGVFVMTNGFGIFAR